MKFLSETIAKELLADARATLRETVSPHEVNAKNCQTCETKGLCCTDVHFVNVRITPLEAKVIAGHIENLPEESRGRIKTRVAESIETLERTDDGGDTSGFYSCPLFDEQIGCSVHDVKPGPCIHHACYEKKSDLPPMKSLDEYDEAVASLNRRVYGRDVIPLPIPIAIGKILSDSALSNPSPDDGDRKK